MKGIFKEEDGYYFADEAAHLEGPFESAEEAEKARDEYTRTLNPFMCCPVCNQGIKKPIKGYHAKPIPIEHMDKEHRPQCDIDKCYRVGKWNVNNGNVLCEKHFIMLATQGIPVFIIAKSIFNEM